MRHGNLFCTVCLLVGSFQLTGCTPQTGEGLSDLAESLGLPFLDDADEAGDFDGPGDAEDDDAKTSIPSTVPAFSAATFSDSTRIDNSYFPLTPGTIRTYLANTPDGVEKTVIEVLSDTRRVNGVACRVVRDRVYIDDVLVEDTRDFFAQDDDGNVWYMGEAVDNYEYDAGGQLLDVTHDGSWEAGRDVARAGSKARPGIQMWAAPEVGRQYHQEYYPGEAEDMGEIVALSVKVTLADGASYDCLQTRDFSPLEPALNEFKYYAPGVGLVLEEAIAGGERAELVSIEP